MKTKKIAEAGVFSAMFIVMTVFAIQTGIAYLGYLDLAVPILIVLLYFKCGFKYTVMSSIVSTTIVFAVMGDVASGICIVQGIILGILCAAVMCRKSCILDDLFYCSITACFILVIIDLSFSSILGYSFVTDYKHMVYGFSFLDDYMKKIMFYVSVGILPLGTMIFTYVFSLILGNRLNLLKGELKNKAFIIRNYGKVASTLFCSKKVTCIGLVYLIFVQLLSVCKINFSNEYIQIIMEAVNYIIIFFILKDSYSFLCQLVYTISKSRMITLISQILIIYMLFLKFKISMITLVVVSFITDIKFNVRNNCIEVLNKYIAVNS